MPILQKMSDLVNNPSEIIVIIPDLPVEAYQLEVVTQFTSNSVFLKEPGTVVLEKILNIV